MYNFDGFWDLMDALNRQIDDDLMNEADREADEYMLSDEYIKRCEEDPELIDDGWTGDWKEFNGWRL